MSNIQIVLVSLIVSILLSFLGYNLVINTQKTIDVFNKYSKASKKKILLNNRFLGYNEIMWMKIAGYGIVLFALITIMLMIVFIYKNSFK